MRVCLRGRASQALLWGALIVTAVSNSGSVVVEAQQPAMRWDGLIELVSGRNEYPPPNLNPPIPADGPSQMSRHGVSGDGRYVVFTANAPSLGFSGPALYLRDRRLSDTRLLFAGGDTTGLRDAVISEDGRHIAFTMCEPWMRPDSAPICDVWSFDILNGGISPLSVSPDTGEFGNADSDDPVLSSNGRYVVFRTAATNLAPGVPAGVPQLVIKDRDPDGNGTYDEPGPLSPNSFQIISAPKGAQGTVPGNAPSATAEVSSNGRYVAFRSAASNLVPGDTNAKWDVFWRDRLARDTRRLNVQVSGSQSPFGIDTPGISMTPDGRYVAFASADPMLGPAPFDDTNQVLDVFLFDAQSLNVQRVDVGWLPYATGVRVPGSGATEWPTLSADGRYVSLQSSATNVEIAPPPNSTHSYVVDRFMNTVTRISIKPDGTDPDQSCTRPQISADGSLVAFVSPAFSLAPPSAYTDSDRVYAAVHLEITPQEQSVSGGAGAAATYDVVTQQHTPWWIDWNQWQPWTDFETPAIGWGSGLLKVRANEANPNPTPRTATIKIFDKSVRFTQLEGLSLTGISPVAGPQTGGTQVTFTGTGFEPGMRVFFNGLDAVAVEYVSSTTLIATTPPHPPATAYVGVMGAPPDYRVAWLDQAFRFTDTTPPQLWYGFSDNPNENGWFNTNVTIGWAWWDPETPVTSTTGCDMTVIATDTPGTTYTCTATSEGGTSSLSAFVKRDATAPTAAITSPAPRLYDLGEVVQPAFTCSDALSGVATCVGATNGAPVDTSTPGYHTFWVSITDRAGNPGWASVEYVVGSGICAYPLPDMVSWWRMEGNTSNMRTATAVNATRVGLTSDVFVDAVVGQGYQFAGANGYLQTNFAPTIFNDKKFAVAAWVNPSANTLGTIMRARELFAVARLANGNIAWAFRKFNIPGLSYRDTGVKLPLGQWNHVVVMLDGTAVRTYLNGRLAHTEPNGADIYVPSSYTATIGGSDSNTDYFKGALDELQIFQHGLNDYEIEQLFLSGNAGACVPKRTSMQIVEPIPAAFGSPTYAFDVRLVDEGGTPVVGRSIELLSQVGAWPYSSWYATRVTDSDGRVHWDAPLNNAPRGLYDRFAYATFAGDVDYVRQSASPDVLVGKGNPVITWPAPAPITYSFPVNSTQLNATASVPGTFSYSPTSGTLLPAGERTLSVTFTPTNTTDYNTVTATNTITVNKATPTVIIEGAQPWVYNGTPPPVVGKVKDRFNLVIATPTLTFDGSPNPPVLPGTYTVVATFPGNANYLPGTATGTLTITKSVVSMQLFVQDAVYDGVSHGAGYLINGFDEFFPADGLTYNGSENPPVNVGTYTVVLTFNGTALYEAATLSKTFTIHKATPTVSVTSGTFTYDGAAHPATGTVTRGGVSLGSPVLTYNGVSEPPVNGGTYNVVGTYAGDANHNAASGSATITINKAVPTVTLAAGAYTYDGQPHPATGTVTGIGGVQLTGLTFTYNGSSEPPVNAGSYAVTGTYPGNTNYQTVTRETAILIGPATPTVTVTGGTFTYDGMSHAATAIVRGVGGVELAGALFTYNGSADAPINAGTYTAVATFDGSGNYGHATGSAVVTILKATAVLAWNRPAAIVYGTSLGGDQLNATSNVFGSFDYSPAANTVLNAGASQTLTATFTPSDPANYNGGTVSTTIDVSKAVAEVTAIGGTFTYNGQPHPASGFVTGLFGAPLGTPTFTYNGISQPPVTVGTYDVVASFAGNANYQPASATTAIAILPAAPVLGWAPVQPIVYGTPLGSAQLSATASVPGTFTYSPAAGTVLNAGNSQLLTATFTSSDPNYSSDGIVNTAIDVVKASPVLSWSQPTAIVHGTALGAGQLNATANVAGSFSYSPAGGTVLNAGASQTLTATFTPADSGNYTGGSVTATIDVSKAAATVTAAGGTFTYDGQPHPATGSVTGLNGLSLGTPTFTYNGSAQPPVGAGSYAVVASFAGNANYEAASASASITIGKAAVVLTWNQPAAIVYGTPLGAAQLNASSNVPGTFAYSPAPGTVLATGAHAVTATFTPADGTNYTGASVGTTIAVAAAPLSIRANDSAKPFGAPLPVFTASAAGFVNGDTFASLGGALAFATSATAQSAVGTYPVVPSGLTSPNYVITFVPGALAVVRGGVAVSVSTSPAPSGLNQTMTFTANVGPAAPAAGAPGGTVRFFDGATLVGSSALASGSASLTTAGLTAGVHTIQATYDGDASFESGSGSASHTVNSASATPSIAIASNRNPSSVGQSVTLTASLSMTAGPVNGTVQFYDGAVLLGTSTIVSGSASFTTTAFVAGSHAITVRYLGSSSAPPVISGVFVQAVGAASWKNRTSTTTVSASPNPSAIGDAVTLTANVNGPNGTPTGAVLFMVNGEVVGGPVTLTAISGSTAQATMVLPGFVGGRHTVTATYLGSSNYKGSTAAVTQIVN